MNRFDGFGAAPEEMKFLMVQPVQSQPRYHRRSHLLTKAGAKVKVLSFARDYAPTPTTSFPVELIGFIEAGNYKNRLLPFLRAIAPIRRNARAADVIYAYGLDMLLLCLVATLGIRCKKRVYEVADIRPALLGSDLSSKIGRWLDRWALKSVDVLVVTSKKYIEDYFHGTLNACGFRYLEIENKPYFGNAVEAHTPAATVPKQHLTIGYFGLLRCHASLRALEQLSAKTDRFRIHARGYTVDGFDATRIDALSNGEYGGPFVSPVDLPDMYNRIDLAWVCYKTANWESARSNRFYEACFYCVPMIVQRDTQDAQVVCDYDIGIAVDLDDSDQLCRHIMSIQDEDLARWRANLEELPRAIYEYGTEHTRLLEMLND
jgi:succinoglycan biosynthesis protein ExoL